MTGRKRASVAYDNTERVVLVTGGANGIGRAIAEAFINTGAQVFVLDTANPTDALDARIVFQVADTSSDDQVKRVVESIVERSGCIDVLVNNAAIQPADSYRPIHEYSAEMWQRMVDVNLSGYAICAKHHEADWSIRHRCLGASTLFIGVHTAFGIVVWRWPTRHRLWH